MPPTQDKTSKFITHLTDQLHAREAEVKTSNARIAKLESELAQERADRHRDLETIARHERDLAAAGESNRSLSTRIAEQGAAIEELRELIASDSELIQGYEEEIAAKDALIKLDNETIESLRARVAELEQRGPDLDAKEAELKLLVAKVEERGRRRDAEEANAIMNRRALAGAVPGRNLR